MEKQYTLQKGKIFDNGSKYLQPKYLPECIINLSSKTYRTKNIQTILMYMNADNEKSLNHLHRCVAKETKIIYN